MKNIFLFIFNLIFLDFNYYCDTYYNYKNKKDIENKVNLSEKNDIKNNKKYDNKNKEKIIKNIDMNKISFDITKYKINENELKNIIDEVKNVNEENRVFIQSDTEGKVFNIISTLQIANIIDVNKPITVYYNINNGKFENDKSENSIELKLFKVNKKFKGTYIHLGDIVDRCTGNYQCLKSLLLLLYIKQELEDKVKLICGNHELTDYFKLGNRGCDCCYNIRNLITLIVFKAISKGQIKYLDKIKIVTTDYILTHKVLYKEDINKIKYFLKNKMEEKKDLKDYDIYKLIDIVNYNFKKYFTNFFNIKDNIDIYDYSFCFDQLSNQIVIDERVDNLGYDICLENQICGHDHHKINECYIKDKNILFVDNFSFDLKTYITKKYQKPMVNIHFFNKNEKLTDHKIFNIIQNENNLDITIY